MTPERLLLVAADVGRAAVVVGSRVLLVGAYARDLCLDADEAPSRATSDADFAVMLESWERVDEFFACCADKFTDINREDLLMYHRETGLKVDIVPCGAIERPRGTLVLRKSDRVLNTVGLVERFKLGTPLHPTVPDVLVPPAIGFVVLKLFAHADRRESRDLRDLGHVLHRLPVDEGVMLEDDAFVDGLADGSLTLDDAKYWQAGRSLSVFSRDTRARVVSALDRLLDEDPGVRMRTIEGAPRIGADERLARADRALAVFRRAAATS